MSKAKKKVRKRIAQVKADQRVEDGCGCAFCDIGLDPKIVDAKPVHPIINPTRDVPCTAPR